MATAPIYCTHQELKRVFPQLDEFDSKTPIYGWVVSSGALYVAHDCGLVTQLFADGADLGAAQASSGAVNVNDEWFMLKVSPPNVHWFERLQIVQNKVETCVLYL